jgi:hypothetical protein
MSKKTSVVKMPELVVILKPLVIGFLLTEVWTVAFGIGSLYAPQITGLSPCICLMVIAALFMLCIYYCYLRDGVATTKKIIKSFRIDLLATLCLGIWLHSYVYPAMEEFHLGLFIIFFSWAPLILLMLLVVILSPILQHWRAKKYTNIQKSYFLSDVEIKNDVDDFLSMNEQAIKFAESVMQSADIFGLDGPWGTGKTSFINLAEAAWSNNSKFLVCRFEPLRFASEPNLADRLIKELTSTIQKSVYAPEFRLAADKYSRLIKGKAELSFFGFKLSFEPSPETVDDLLDDIDEALKRINRRVIIVIDDLDRLDAKTINNILFATKRTLNLTQATYVLCYDTEVLTGTQEENSKAREFLEKFVTIKFSLFSDTSKICDFFRGKWKDHAFQDGSTPSDAIQQLSSIFDELANILESDKAAHYLPLIGNMRKAKRLINTIRLMQIEQTNLGRTDFNKHDLINLIFLHLNYPGLFRQIYAEETGDNIGSFSIKRDSDNKNYINSCDFSKILEAQSKDISAVFLLKQLFDVNTLVWDSFSDPGESDFASRACFNNGSHRNLQAYLKLIVRVVTPEPQATLILYKEALNKIQTGASIISILNDSDFTSDNWEYAHERLWIEILNQSYNLPASIVDQAIDTLITYLPNYPSVKIDNRGLRHILIYTLIQLLDRAGWGSESRRRDSASVLEIAWRIFGENEYNGRGLLSRLVTDERGALGWFDLLLFRLQCSTDRQGQIHNLSTALIRHQDPNAETSGRVDKLTINEMRLISQKIFLLFKSTYIEPRRNFIVDVDKHCDDVFLGRFIYEIKSTDSKKLESIEIPAELAKQILIKRSIVKSFVIYQLSNSLPPTGSGIGCGYYDEDGLDDNKGIANAMNDYIFNVCFNPTIDEKNAFHFFNHCLAHLKTPFDTGVEGLVASQSSLAEGLDSVVMGSFWQQHNDIIRQVVQSDPSREVHTSNYSVKYEEVMESVFSTLDDMAKSVLDLDK